MFMILLNIFIFILCVLKLGNRVALVFHVCSSISQSELYTFVYVSLCFIVFEVLTYAFSIIIQEESLCTFITFCLIVAHRTMFRAF